MASDNYESEYNNYGATDMEDSNDGSMEPYLTLGIRGLTSKILIFDVDCVYFFVYYDYLWR